MILKRTLYLAYYFKELDRQKFKNFFSYVKKRTGKNSLSLWYDLISSSYRYNIGLMDYFIFRFFEKTHTERSKWVGTGYKYEFDLRMNPKGTRDILENKIKFYEAYRPFINHSYCTIEDLAQNNPNALEVFNNSSGKVVIKDSLGQCGWDVEIIKTSEYTPKNLFDYMKSKGFDMAEEFIQQHDKINELSSTGLNTIRMFTVISNSGGVDFIGARMRISVNSHVDNLASGNIACPIDIETGKIFGPGVFSDITKEDVTHHPVTGVELIGFQIPMWNEIIKLTEKIALHYPQNRGVGWDIALTDDAVDFIEGNHNWCKILWQLPVKKGLKEILEKYN